MTSYIALLRGINVGGNKKVVMADLQTMVAGLGFVGASTLLNSGNVVFQSDRKITAAALEILLEAEAAERLGLRTDFHVRTALEWRTLIDLNPLPAAAARNPSHFIAWSTKVAPTPAAVEALRAANPGPEVIRAVGRHLYFDYGGADTMRASRLTPALLDAKLGTRGTGRNWNTVLKLAALTGA